MEKSRRDDGILLFFYEKEGISRDPESTGVSEIQPFLENNCMNGMMLTDRTGLQMFWQRSGVGEGCPEE